MEKSKDQQAQLEQQEAVHRQNVKEKVNNVRYIIRILQEIPFVLALVVFINYFSDLLLFDVSEYEYALFGFSAYILIRLCSAARKLYVSKWSIILYYTLILISIVEFVDSVIYTEIYVVYLQELLNIIIITGIASSFVTFIYGKFKDSYRKHH